MEHLGNILLISLFCVGWGTLLDEGMLLEKLDKQLQKLPKMLYKPLGGCVPCSASIVGLAAYFLLFSLENRVSFYLPNGKLILIQYGKIAIYLVSAVAVNQIFWFVKSYLMVATSEKEIVYETRLQQKESIEKLKVNSGECKQCGNNGNTMDNKNAIQ